MKRSLFLLFILSLMVPVLFPGCADDGSNGTNGISSLTSVTQEPAGSNCANGGQKIDSGQDLNGNGALDLSEITSTQYVCNGSGTAAEVSPESCAVCHNGNLVRDGFTHQALYDELYQDGVLAVSNVAYTNNGTSDIVTFNMTKAGQPFDCTELNAWQDPPVGTGSSLGITFVGYDAATRSFNPPAPLTSDLSIGNAQTRTTASTLTYDAGTNLCTSTKAQSAVGDLSALNGLIVVYGRNDARSAQDESPELAFTRVVQAKFPFAATLEMGAGVDYVSGANVSGCEKCHTVPFLKHGYIYGLAGGIAGNDFYTCKACHDDNGNGGHFEWQLLVEDPPRAASYLGFPPPEVDLTPAEEAQYAYKTRLMNDVHMSHAMEFPYPQSMSNCVVCHDGKLNNILTDANFAPVTCLSCHPENGPAGGTDEKRAPALRAVAPPAIHSTMNFKTAQCNLCHSVAGGFTLFSEIHSGYDKSIYDTATGTKFSSAIAATIDSASFAGNVLTINFSAAGSLGGLNATDIAPTLLVGLYGYNTKDYYVGPHERDFDDNGDGIVSNADQRNLEYVVGRTNHPRFTTVSSGGGSWVVTANLAAWDNLITSGVVKRLEIAVLPTLQSPSLPAGDNVVALNAPSKTFNLVTNAFEDNYYSGTNAIVRVDTGCNNCHDALADTFHSPDRGGNIVVCRLCHITKDPGGHLEMQSRSIDSYAHGIHSFQPFDINNVDFTDPVEAMEYEHHIRFAFPTLGRTNCESCHNAGKYNVPDQSKSMPGTLSASEFPIIFENLNSPDGFPDGQRNIGQVPSYVAGPASRACGGCHRVNWINEDNAGDLAAFYGHMKTFGYLVETTSATDGPDTLTVTDTIMGII